MSAAPDARRRRLALAGVVALAALVVVLASLHGGRRRGPTVLPGQAFRSSDQDPLAYSPGDDGMLAVRAAAGLSHVIYVRTPGGVVAAARRTARFRGGVQTAARAAGVDPDVLEGLVLLESAGRPDAVAGPDPSAAAGLTQILPQTATALLGMHVDLAAGRRLGRSIARARAGGHPAQAARLEPARRRADQRFDPGRALAGAVRYLGLARRRFGRDDLAVVSYHMGMGNLEGVLRAYAGPGATGAIAKVVQDRGLSYARVFFDSGPDRHPAAWRRLLRLGDESSRYLWKVLAARDIMSGLRNDPAGLARVAALQVSRPSGEALLHGPSEALGGIDALQSAARSGALVRLPPDPGAVFARYGPVDAGSPAPQGLYRGLRPPALAMLLYIAARVHAISGAGAPLVVTRAVTTAADPRPSAQEGTPGFSMHSTGWAFDVARRYSSPRQASAFQYELDRLSALDLIAWAREPRAIHVTVAAGASSLVDRLRPAARRLSP